MGGDDVGFGEGFAVVGGDDDEGVVGEAGFSQVFEEAAELLVGDAQGVEIIVEIDRRLSGIVVQIID